MTSENVAQGEYINVKEACKILGVCTSTLYNYIENDESFPKRLRVGPRSIRFRRGEIIYWLETNTVT